MKIIEIIKNMGAFDASTPLLFTQFQFWVFFAAIFAIFSLFHNRKLLRNTFLFAASLFFYYKTSGLFILILLFSTLSDYSIALFIDKAQKNSWRKTAMILSVFINLSILAYFKYSYFFTDVINQLFHTHFVVYDYFAAIGNTLSQSTRFSVDKIILPVGISFYTFQTISYSVDVYRRKIKPVKNILDFGFYVSFFPQLVAGPIVRAADFIPQLYKPYFLSRRQFGIAIFWILNGLAKKIILSDYLAVNFIDRIFQNPLLFSGFENLMALFTYSLQVYADFSGYTDIAIGVAMLMGFYLPTNFNSPYKATNAAYFWRRWHMSLSSWLKDYLYIPLGGNRSATFGTFFWILLIAGIGIILSGTWIAGAAVGGITLIIVIIGLLRPKKRDKIFTNINNMNTMLLGGLWHGASWNFMIWGGLNGAGIIIYKLWRQMNMHIRMLTMLILTLSTELIRHYYPNAFWNMMLVWVLLCTLGTLVRWIYSLLKGQKEFKWAGNAWGIVQTFIFMSFTRLFFRSGSNLDPSEANNLAWETAKNMVHQIGGNWTFDKIHVICWEYKYVFLMFILGMLIHWLPNNFKRWYRIQFSRLSIPSLFVCIIVAVFILYQFVTSELQPFIYFQF